MTIEEQVESRFRAYENDIKAISDSYDDEFMAYLFGVLNRCCICNTRFFCFRAMCAHMEVTREKFLGAIAYIFERCPTDYSWTLKRKANPQIPETSIHYEPSGETDYSITFPTIKIQAMEARL